MRIYSNALTESDLEKALPSGCRLECVSIYRPRTARNGWIVRLAGGGNRWRNSGKHGAERVKAATYDQHGEWFANLYDRDPDARIGPYRNREDFHAKTDSKYAA